MSDKNTEQGQPRTVPTRPGRWYAQWAHDEPSDDMIFIASVLQDEHRLFVHLGGVTSDLRALRFIAPIPGPAVLAALAEYGEALAACYALAAPEDYEDDTAMLTFEACRDARRAMDAAIRAERDADRGGAAIDALRETEDRWTTHWQGCEAVHPRCAVYRAADAARGAVDARECRCSLRTRLVGDGCDICNPELAAEYARQREATDGD